ncbi:MAG: hypothetical protein HYZ63_03510, partial [Candidatus Andersenbacteria bacterium]|nr:hypothetical protein [Candidatus Andersenbacteria bacterium]
MKSKMNIAWDLSDLYSGIDDPRIEADVKAIEKSVAAFEVAYRGKIDEKLSVQGLRQMLDTYSALIQRIRKLEVYASLEHSTHVDIEEYGAFYQHVATKAADLQSGLVFLETDLVGLFDKKLQMFIDEPTLKPYRHYLEKKLVQKQHYLSEDEEKILQQKSLTGRQA